MLERIRSLIGSWLAWVIIGLLVIPFAFWGIGSYIQPDSTVAVAEVDGEPIPFQLFQRELRRQGNELQRLLGERYSPDQLDQPAIRSQVAERLVNNRLLTDRARATGLVVSDEALSDSLAQTPALQGEDGQFDPQRYEQMLRLQGITAPDFESNLRAALVMRQITQGVAGSAFITDYELDLLAGILLERRDLVFTSLPAERYLEQVEVEPEAVEAHYREQADRYRSTARVTVDYVLLEPGSSGTGAEPDEQTLRERYRQREDSFVQPERRQVRHILIEVPEDAADEVVAAARERAQALRQQTIEGADFAALARKASDDVGSAARGGDLGEFGRGVMDPQFEQVAFKLPAEEVSEPVRTPFGFHLIEVTRIVQEQRQPFEAVRDELAAELRREQAEGELLERADELHNLAFEYPESLTPAADALGLEVRTTPPFDAGGLDEGPAAHDGFVEAAFSKQVLAEGLNSDLITLDDTRYAVLRLRSHQPAENRPLDEVREQIVAELREEKARDMARKQGEAIVEALRAGTDREALAAEHSLEWDRSSAVSRSQRDVIPAAAMTGAFAAPAPAPGETSYGGQSLGDGDYFIYGVTGVDAAPADTRQQILAQLRQELAQLHQQGAMQAYLTALGADAEVRYYPENFLTD